MLSKVLIFIGGSKNNKKEFIPLNPDGLYPSVISYAEETYKRDCWFDVGNNVHVGIMRLVEFNWNTDRYEYV